MVGYVILPDCNLTKKSGDSESGILVVGIAPAAGLSGSFPGAMAQLPPVIAQAIR
jgi:hypothetical protein